VGDVGVQYSERFSFSNTAEAGTYAADNGEDQSVHARVARRKIDQYRVEWNRQYGIADDGKRHECRKIGPNHLTRSKRRSS
jgi:hypothetical protein